MLSSASIWTAGYWKSVAERAISTGAQSAVAYLGLGAINVVEIDWTGLGGIAAGGVLLSVLKSLAVNAVAKNGPGVGDAEHVSRPTPDFTGPDSLDTEE